MRIVVDSKNPYLAEALKDVAEVQPLGTSAITREVLLHADAVVVRSETKVGPALLDGTPVKFVGTATIGTDHVDLDYLGARGIGFASAPGSNANSVAEYLAATLLETAARHNISLEGKTLGVVGVGNVGSRAARVGTALGMRVLRNDPPLARSTRDPGYLPLDAVMEADFVTLHVPLTRSGEDPTFHLFDDKRIARMKRGSFLINTSRGPVTHGDSLRSALQSGHLSGAVLDVWEGEPTVDPALLGEVIIGTPHIAGYSFDGKVNAARMMFEALVRHFGLQKDWPTPEAMPRPRTQHVRLPRSSDSQELLRLVVAQCYPIMEDDARFRTLLALAGDEQRAEFRKQRSTYPVRREFHATRVTTGPDAKALAVPLKQLGFSVQEISEEV
jgi:erythronate-4-phosphate dehydrogenase